MGLAEVSDILWRERELLDVLLFKLEEEQLLLEQIRLTELTRSIEVDAAASQLGVEPNPSLGKLAEVAPAPWNDLFTAHRAAFLMLTQEISGLADANREFVTTAYRSARETLLAIGGGNQLDNYTATGRRAGAVRQRTLLDEAI
jgi:hypothetical protein